MKPALKEIFKDYLSPHNGESIHHIGSSAIQGMPGTGGLDITITTSGLLPNIPENIIREMKKIGFDFCGPSPHCMNKNLD